MFALRTAPKARTLTPLTRAYGGSGAPSGRGSGYAERASYDRQPRADLYGGERQPYQQRQQRPTSRVDKMAAKHKYSVQHAARRLDTPPPHLLTLGDLAPEEIQSLVSRAYAFKILDKKFGRSMHRPSLSGRTVALLFSKRSTRTRVATETSVATLGGHASFLGKDDIQLGVNESLEDSARVISSMVDGIMARVNKHEDVAGLAEHSTVPVINALCDLYHPTQILADLLTMVETYAPVDIEPQQYDGALPYTIPNDVRKKVEEAVDLQAILSGKKVAWVGDQNNITNELMVTLPRFGMEMGVAAPKGYDEVDPRVAERM